MGGVMMKIPYVGVVVVTWTSHLSGVPHLLWNVKFLQGNLHHAKHWWHSAYTYVMVLRPRRLMLWNAKSNVLALIIWNLFRGNVM